MFYSKPNVKIQVFENDDIIGTSNIFIPSLSIGNYFQTTTSAKPKEIRATIMT